MILKNIIKIEKKHIFELIGFLLYFLLLLLSYPLIYEAGVWQVGFEADFSFIKLLIGTPFVTLVPSGTLSTTNLKNTCRRRLTS